MQSDDYNDMGRWPQEILFSLFKSLDQESFDPSGLVCRKWFQMSKDNELWRQKYAEQWPELPIQNDFKRNLAIPLKEGGTCIDWKRLYILQSTLPSLIQVLQHLYDNFDATIMYHFSRGSEKTVLATLIHGLKRRGLKSIFQIKTIQRLINYIKKYYQVALALKDEDPYTDLQRHVEDITRFLLTLDLVLISKPTAAHAKLIGISVQYFQETQHSLLNVTISNSLLRFIAQFTHEFIYQVEKKDLSYTDGFSLISYASELFFVSRPNAPKSTAALDLGFDMLHLLVYALINWPIECEIVLSRKVNPFSRVAYTLHSCLRNLNLTIFECFKRTVQPIFPPKTPRESLMVLYISGKIVKYDIMGLADAAIADLVYSLPNPIASPKDKNLILYHYEVLKRYRPSDDDDAARDISATVNFLINILLDIPYSWQVQLLNQLAEDHRIFSPEQEEALFQKIRALGNRPGWKGLSEKWTVQFAVCLGKISEYKELIVKKLLGDHSLYYFRHGIHRVDDKQLLEVVMEVYEKNPREALEWLLLSIADSLISALPLNLGLLAIKLIGKKLTYIRSYSTAVGDITPDDLSMEMYSDDEELEMPNGEDVLMNEHEIEGEQTGGDYDLTNEKDTIERIKLEDAYAIVSPYDSQPWNFTAADFMNMLTSILRKLPADILKQQLPLLLEIVKKEFNNKNIQDFYYCMVKKLVVQDPDTEVADTLALSLVQWIRTTNERGQRILCSNLHSALLNLLQACSKDFLEQDVLRKLSSWVVNAISGFEKVDLWVLAVEKMEDRTAAVQEMYDKISEYAADGDFEEEYIAMSTTIMLLESKAFELASDLVPLLMEVWGIDHTHERAAYEGVSFHDKTRFLEAAAQYYPAFVQGILPEALSFLETEGHKNDMVYLMVISLIKDELLWSYHMEKLIKHFRPPDDFFSLDRVIQRLAFSDLLLLVHPFHKRLFPFRKSIMQLFQKIEKLIGNKESVGFEHEKRIISGLVKYFQHLSDLEPEHEDIFIDYIATQCALNNNNTDDQD